MLLLKNEDFKNTSVLFQNTQVSITTAAPNAEEAVASDRGQISDKVESGCCFTFKQAF